MDCCFRSKNASKIPHRYLSEKSSSKHTELFGRTLNISMSCLLDMMLILFPLFSNLVCRVYSQTLSEPSSECSMRIPHPHLQRFAYVMADFYHRLWQTKFIRPDNPCNKCTLRIRQTQGRYMAELVYASAQYIQIDNVGNLF